MPEPRKAHTTTRRLVDQVASSLSRMVADGSLQPGDQLPSEQALAERFAVSKPVVREALRHLTAMGLVKGGRGRRAEVQALGAEPLEAYFGMAVQSTPGGLLETVQLRRALEEYMVQLAVVNAAEADIARLKFAVGVLGAAADLTDEWIQADLRFHSMIAEIAGNRLLANIFSAAHGAIAEMIRVITANHQDFEKSASLRRHEAIYKAIAERDAESARKAMSIHFDPVEAIARTVERRREEMPWSDALRVVAS